MDFLTIQNNIRVPLAYIEFDNSQDNQGLSQEPNSILIIGQTANAGAKVGTTANGVISPVNGGADGEAQFGRGSMLAEEIWAFYGAFPNAQVYAIGLADNGAGTAATGTLTVTGPATAAGTLALYIAGVAVPVAVSAADTATVIATNIAAAVNANQRLPVTAASALGVVTLTCPWKGVTGNDPVLALNDNIGDITPAGVAVAIVAMNGGTQNPALTSVVAAMGDIWFGTIVNPYTDAANYATLHTELQSRFGGMRQIDGTAFHAVRGSYSANLTFGGTVNDQCMDFEDIPATTPQPVWIWAAVNAAVNAFEKQTDPNRPRQTVPMPGLLPPPLADRRTWAERNNLLYNGLSTFTVAGDGTVMIERQITSYQKNALGVADPSYYPQEKMDLLSFLRYDTRVCITNKFPRAKLVPDGTTPGPGVAFVTPTLAKAALVERATDWVKAGYIANIADFIAGTTCVINAGDNTRLDTLMDPTLVEGLSVFAAQIQFKG